MRTSKIVSLMLLLGLVTTTAACSNKTQAAPSSGPRVIPMAVTANGFEPAKLKVKAGQPLKLVVTRQTDRTCAKQIVIADYGINQPLPLNQPVEVAFTPSKSGEVRYACGMDMISGVLVVE